MRIRSSQESTVFSCAPPRISRVMTWAIRMVSIITAFIVDAYQKQSLRRCRGAGGAAVGGGEALGDPRFVFGAAAYFHETADDRPNHVVEEPVGLDLDRDEVLLRPPAPLHAEPVDGADAVLALCTAGFEAAEIVCAQEWPGGAGHGGVVETPVVLPAISTAEDIADRPVVDHVTVALAHCIADRVKTPVCVGGLQHGNVVRQLGVQCPPEHVGRQGRFRAEADHLTQGVNTGVGSAPGDAAG